jgi:hypothetical protein
MCASSWRRRIATEVQPPSYILVSTMIFDSMSEEEEEEGAEDGIDGDVPNYFNECVLLFASVTVFPFPFVW